MSNLKLTNCPYCHESGDLYFSSFSKSYYRCSVCHLIYLDVKNSYDDVVDTYRENCFDKYSADQLDERGDRLYGHILKLIGKKREVGQTLDVGTGCGFFLVAAKYVTQYVTVSKALKEILVKERSIPADKIRVVYNGVELDQYNPNLQISDEVRQSLAISDNYPIVETIGRLVYQKGLPYFLEAAQYVNSEKQYVRFVIVGGGPEEANLKRLANDLGISHLCTFTGLRFDIIELLSAFDALVLSSLLEGLPRVVIEAMAMARPIVAADISGIREQLRHNETGLLVPPADSKTLAGAILNILNDRERAERLGQEARKCAERKFNLQFTLTNIEDLYDRILSSALQR